MNKYTLIGGLVVVVAIVGFALTKKSPTSNNTAAVVQSQSSGSQLSMKDLLAVSKPQKCDFKDSSTGASTEGTMFVANGKIRGDFKSTSQGQTASGHMIIVNNIMNSWTEGYPVGVTLSFDSQEARDSGISPDKKIDFTCSDWTPDESVFAAPTDITFKDIKSFMAQPDGATQ